MQRVARMLRAHLEHILTYLTHRITNATTEGLDAKLPWIEHSARDYRDWEAFKRAIYVHSSGPDLAPRVA
jgi:transposase